MIKKKLLILKTWNNAWASQKFSNIFVTYFVLFTTKAAKYLK